MVESPPTTAGCAPPADGDPYPPSSRRKATLPPAWPLTALLAFFPLWWALGLRSVAFAAFAAAMAAQLLRKRPIRVPPGFGLWMLFLLWYIAGAAMLGSTAPGTVPEPATDQLTGFAFRLVNYVAATIILLYVGNLTESEMPRHRLVKLLGVFGLVTVGGGLIGVLWPHLSFTSPFEALLPQSLRSKDAVQDLTHPAVAQLHDVLGYTSPRPKAPFSYTNVWGNNFSILVIWLIVGWYVHGSRRQRWVTVLACCLAAIPVVYSLDRGLWVGLVLSVLYAAVRLATRGRVVLLGMIAVATAFGVMAFMASPLQDMVRSRFEHPHSNDGRGALSAAALEGAVSSPVVGYGSSRSMRGTAKSIAIGPSSQCQNCGIGTIGSNGQFWLVVFANGFVGAGLYVSFFLYSAWRYRRDRSPIGTAGVLVLLLSLCYILVYGAVSTTLGLYFISLALLWRGDMRRRDAAALTDRSRPSRGLDIGQEVRW